MYPAATRSFSEAGTRRCSTLNLRTACVNSAKTFARLASDVAAEDPALAPAEFVVAGEEFLLQPMPTNKTAQTENKRRGIRIVCLRAFRLQAMFWLVWLASRRN